MLSENDKKIINNVILNTILNDDFDDEVKIRRIERFEEFGGDVKAQFFGKSMLVWAKEKNVGDGIIKYLEGKGVKEEAISKEEANEKAKSFWDENGEIKSLEEVKKLVYEGANLGVNVRIYENIFQDLGFNEINEVLKILPKGYVIDGDVKLSYKDLEELPDFSNVIVAGDFWCSNNQLTSLRGAPTEVGGSFECYGSQLTSLKGAPTEVGGVFSCSNNQLISLEGGPSEVGGNFDCSGNNLTSLKGAPKKVGWGFDCHENQLTSLRGAPTEVGGDFDCKENESLESLDGRPKKIGRGFYCNKEVLERIEKNKKIEQNFSGFDNGR